MSYVAEVEYQGPDWTPCRLETVSSPSYTFDVVGAQPGRWRVRAVAADGTEGEPSGWWYFSYTV